MKDIHSRKTAQGASQDAHTDQGGFFYSPFVVPGLVFIHSEADEGQKRDDNDIQFCCSQYIQADSLRQSDLFFVDHCFVRLERAGMRFAFRA